MLTFKRLVLLALFFLLATFLLVRVSDVDGGAYEHPAGRVARAARWPVDSRDVLPKDQYQMTQLITVRERHHYIRQVGGINLIS